MNDVDAALSTLSNKHRRRVLLALLDHNPQTVEELSTPDDTHTGDTEGLRVELHHSHLPKLEAAGLVEWDRETYQVVKGPRFGEIKPLLELLVTNVETLPGTEL